MAEHDVSLHAGHAKHLGERRMCLVSAGVVRARTTGSPADTFERD
jgi:hypothetical protein